MSQFEGQVLSSIKGLRWSSVNLVQGGGANIADPGVLCITVSYDKDTSSSVVTVMVPSEKGIGLTEIYRIIGVNKAQRAVRVQRRYRRALVGEEGNRIVQMLEIQK